MKQKSPQNEIKINKIVQKSENVFELFLEKKIDEAISKERIDVARDVLADHGILQPTTITEAQYALLKQHNIEQQAYEQALKYLVYRKRSVAEVRRFLAEKSLFPEAIIESVIKKLLSKNYLNDQDFIVSYIRTALKTTLAGPERLTRDLIGFGCNEKMITEYVHQLFSEAKQKEQLEQLFHKMLKKKYFSPKQMLDKYTKKAIELGYGYDVIAGVKAGCAVDRIEIDEDKIKKLIAHDDDRLSKKAYSDYERKQRIRHKLQTKGISYEQTNRYLTNFYEELGNSNEK